MRSARMHSATATKPKPRRKRAPSAPSSIERSQMLSTGAAAKSAAPFFMKKMRRSIQILLPMLMVMLISTASMAQDTSSAPLKMQVAGLDFAAWMPNPSTPGPWASVLFSHGFHGCSTQSTFLMKALADSGYAVFAPNHKDFACRDLRAWMSRPESEFEDPRGWTDATYADRAQDLEKLIDALSHDPRYGAAPFDWNHLALAGHSLGGYTVLGLGGAWPKWKDPRVKAILALSPYAAPFIAKETLKGLEAPV